ncbi:TPA: hypothetical protein U1B53_002098 [Streptococcus suis]|nr:hypothetical protein [Streptococcus suis]
MFKKSKLILVTMLFLGTLSSGSSFIASASSLSGPVRGGTPASAEENLSNGIATRAAQGKNYNIPGNKGTLTANVWRSNFPSASGNTYQWDYQVSATYSGQHAVESIRTTWQGGASLRNSASVSLGISNSQVNVGAGSSWQYVNTPVKYWENTNGSKSSDYRSNLVVSPSSDYRSGTISLKNTARVKLKGDPKPYEITGAV